jgi:hypothetical protein
LTGHEPPRGNQDLGRVRTLATTAWARAAFDGHRDGQAVVGGAVTADFDFEAGILEVARSVVKVSRQHHPQGKTFLVRDYTGCWPAAR